METRMTDYHSDFFPQSAPTNWFQSAELLDKELEINRRNSIYG
jgi:hypothetical protein